MSAFSSHRPDAASSSLKTGLLFVLLAAASLATSFALACAAPLAAFAALAALNMRRAEAMILVGTVWFAGQAVGFAFLHYPTNAGTFAWAAGLLVAALAGLEGASFAAHRLAAGSIILRALCTLAAALVAYKLVTFLLGIGLGGNAAAFKPAVLAKFVWTNGAAFAVITLIYRLGAAVGLAVPATRVASVTA